MNAFGSIYSRRLNEGINIRFGKAGVKLVSIVDYHEDGVNTSIESNPTKAVYEMPDKNKIVVYSIFQRNNRIKQQDGNPLLYALKNENKYQFDTPYIEKLFWKRFDAILDKFIEQYNEDVVILSSKHVFTKPEIVLPSSKPINKKIAEKLNNKLDDSYIIDDLVIKKSVEEIWDMCCNTESYFYKYWSRNVKDIDDIYDKLSDELDKMNGEFRIHTIKDMDLRMSITDTLKLNSDTIDNYHSIINGSNILIIDDTITTGQSFQSAYSAITSCYFPKTITGLTMFSGK